jgi:hypothetical protein
VAARSPWQGHYPPPPPRHTSPATKEATLGGETFLFFSFSTAEQSSHRRLAVVPASHLPIPSAQGTIEGSRCIGPCFCSSRPTPPASLPHLTATVCYSSVSTRLCATHRRLPHVPHLLVHLRSSTEKHIFAHLLVFLLHDVFLRRSDHLNGELTHPSRPVLHFM